MPWRARRARRRGSPSPRLCAQLIRLSRLYESAAAYVTDQPAFLNAAALVETPLGPRALLTALKAIEVRIRGSPAVETPIG